MVYWALYSWDFFPDLSEIQKDQGSENASSSQNLEDFVRPEEKKNDDITTDNTIPRAEQSRETTQGEATANIKANSNEITPSDVQPTATSTTSLSSELDDKITSQTNDKTDTSEINVNTEEVNEKLENNGNNTDIDSYNANQDNVENETIKNKLSNENATSENGNKRVESKEEVDDETSELQRVTTDETQRDELNSTTTDSKDDTIDKSTSLTVNTNTIENVESLAEREGRSLQEQRENVIDSNEGQEGVQEPQAIYPKIDEAIAQSKGNFQVQLLFFLLKRQGCLCHPQFSVEKKIRKLF